MSDFKKLFIESLESQWHGLAAILPQLILAVIALSSMWLFAWFIRNMLRRAMSKGLHDKLLVKFLTNIAYWFVILIGLSLALKIAGWGGIAGGIVAGAGVGAFIIGFAFKDIGENFLAGILMAFSRPFRVGDTVEVNGIEGKVVSLDLRNTHVKTFDGKDVYIPNGSIIKNNLFNHTIDGFMRYDFTLGIDQDDDYDRALEIVLDVVSAAEGVLGESRKPIAIISGTDSNSVLIRVFYWIDTFNRDLSVNELRSKVLGNSIKALLREGFYLPNTIMELKNYRDYNLGTHSAAVSR